MEKKLYRSKKDKKLAGVCGGFAAYFGIDATIIRVLWIIAVVCAGFGALAYILCAFLIPEDPTNVIEG